MEDPIDVEKLKEKLVENYNLNVEDVNLSEVLENIASLKMLKKRENKFSIL